VKAVRAAASGHRYVSRPLSLGAVLTRARSIVPLDPYERLTAREREVLRLAAEGYGNPSVAALLGTSRPTAETHRARLMRKLGLASQTELVRYAIERGMVLSEAPDPLGIISESAIERVGREQVEQMRSAASSQRAAGSSSRARSRTGRGRGPVRMGTDRHTIAPPLESIE
jgi:DNA-binding CsgD family transcriptional regulator